MADNHGHVLIGPCQILTSVLRPRVRLRIGNEISPYMRSRQYANIPYDANGFSNPHKHDSRSLCCLALWSCSGVKDLMKDKPSGSLVYLKGEFDQIPALPDSSTKRPARLSEKGSQGLVVTEYVSSGSTDEIKAHYKVELLKRGWAFCCFEKVIYRNHDYGGEHVFYRKQIYVADIQFAGQQEKEFGWKYSFSMSWGLFNDVECTR